MELWLLRHGKPDIDCSIAMRTADMYSWINQYDAAGIIDLPDGSILAACDEKFIVASPMRRARESVIALGRTPDLIIDELHEARLPVFNIPLLTLSPLTWAALFRISWMAGCSGGVATFSAAKGRAKRVSDQLTALTETQGRVVSMGHGFMNLLIAKELQKVGWKIEKNRTSGYWSTIKLVR